LIDFTESIRKVNCIAPAFYLREKIGLPMEDDLLTSADIEQFKHAGGFNDDWDLTFAIVLYFLVKRHETPDTDAGTLLVTGLKLQRFAYKVGEKGGGLKTAEEFLLGKFMPRDQEDILRIYHKPTIRKVFQAIYAGDLCKKLYHFDPENFKGNEKGYIYKDKPLIDLSLLPEGMTPSVFTGRTYEETIEAMALTKLDGIIPQEHWVTKRDGVTKPSPVGLQTLVKKTGSLTGGIYIGDMIDDVKTVQAYNEKNEGAPFLSALVLTGPEGASNRKRYEKSQADIIADNVNEVLKWINDSRK
jgi:HAD superfamily phosphatase